jgi:uncharacterized protein YerC
MPQVSKRYIGKDINERINDIFLKTILSFHSRKELSAFLQEFLTPTEKIMLSKRISIAFLLAKEYTYEQISHILKVSTTTVGNVAMSYKYLPNLKKVIDTVQKDEKIEEFLLNIAEKGTSILARSGGKGKSWKYLSNEVKKKKYSKPY